MMRDRVATWLACEEQLAALERDLDYAAEATSWLRRIAAHVEVSR
jgi:hypothetical protein